MVSWRKRVGKHAYLIQHLVRRFVSFGAETRGGMNRGSARQAGQLRWCGRRSLLGRRFRSVSIPLERKKRKHASVDNWEPSCRRPRRRQCGRVWIDKVSQLDGAQTRNTRIIVSTLYNAISTGCPSTVAIFDSTTTSTPSASTTTKKVEVWNLRCGHGGGGGWRKLGAQAWWGTGGAGIASPAVPRELHRAIDLP